MAASTTTNVEVEVTLISLESGGGSPALAWAAVAIEISGVAFEIHGIAIVRDGRELVCRAPRHFRDGATEPSVGVPQKVSGAISEVVFSAYNRGIEIPATRLPRVLRTESIN